MAYGIQMSTSGFAFWYPMVMSAVIMAAVWNSSPSVCCGAPRHYCPASFEHKAFSPQPFKGNCYQSWCTVTGGAYHSARRVSLRVRSD
jgi:hypothetical protein